MNTIIVSKFPPEECGIAKYAEQHFNFLKEEKEGNVDRITNLNVSFKSPLIFYKLLLETNFRDRVIFHFDYSFYYSRRLGVFGHYFVLGFLVLFFFRKNTEVVIHEFPRASNLFLKNKIIPLFLRSAPKLKMFSKSAADNLLSFYCLKSSQVRLEIINHNSFFKPFAILGKDDARIDLGIAIDKKIILSIGFISPNKGLETVIKAFSGIERQDLGYYIVGGVQPDFTRFSEKIESLATNINNIKVLTGFVTDQEFDKWICAADVLVFAYEEISSSGVLARAHLLNRRSIIINHPALIEEKRYDDIIFKSIEELRDILESL